MAVIHNGTVISLRGWHPGISREEAYAMFPEANISRTKSRRLLIANGESEWSRSNLMAGCECVLLDGGIAEWQDIDTLLSQITTGKIENMAVECWRHEGKIDVSTMEIEKSVGGLFHDEGSTFDLENPTNRMGIVLDASANSVAWGWMVGPGPGKQGWSAMRANNRPFFRPVSLEPRLARAAVNIAAGIKQGLVVDPMCGTGGIVIESALTGRETIGIDFDPEMVIGSKQNLEWAGVSADVKRADATRFEFPNNTVAVVVDPPYGRNSKGDDLVLVNMLENLSKQIPNCDLVVILPTEEKQNDLDESIDFDIEIPHVKVEIAYAIPVHKSLGRMMVIGSVFSQD